MFRRLRVRSLSVLLTASMLALLIPAQVASAAGTYTGGLTDVPVYVSNDHTPFGVTFSVAADAGLTPNTTYAVKIRFTLGTSPSPSTNRGFTWNPTSSQWIQEGDNWALFPTVTTAADGSIPNTWYYGKFGDETKSGPYYMMISLKAGAADTLNPTVLPVVTVLDSATTAAKVHNGAATGQAAGRVEITDPASSTVVWSLNKTELNLVDSDSNGVVDDAAEDRGPVGISGDYTLVGPAEQACDLYIKRSLKINDAVIGAADTDIALGVADMTPPSAPSTCSVEATATGMEVAWGGATDNVGVTGYTVHRSAVPTTSLPSIPVKDLIASVDGAERSFVDTTTEAGVLYTYEVRALDAATNIGPRASVTMPVPPHVVGLDRTSGADRYSTALAVSEATFPGSSVTTVVVATGRNYPDALSATGLAGAYHSPVLLVGDSVTASLTAEIDRLGASAVAIVGGTSAVSASVAAALDASYDIDRIQGPDRYSTAAAVARKVDAAGGNVSTAFVVRGDAFPDALAGAPFAFARAMPILLTRSTSLSSATADILAEIGSTNAIVLGGETAVSAGVLAELDTALPGTAARWSGADRYETAANVAQYGVARGWASWQQVGLATGLNYPDALGGGAAMGARGGVMLLTSPSALSGAAAAAIAANVDTIDRIEVFGGENAVATEVYDAVGALLP